MAEETIEVWIVEEWMIDIIQATKRHSLEVGFNHSAATAKELQERLDGIERMAGNFLEALDKWAASSPVMTR